MEEEEEEEEEEKEWGRGRGSWAEVLNLWVPTPRVGRRAFCQWVARGSVVVVVESYCASLKKRIQEKVGNH